MALYDSIYDVKNYFGKPYQELIQFFKNLPERGNILDVGCGQGRDAISLAKLGYKVFGIDISKLGIEQMIENAAKLDLCIGSEVSDMFKYRINQDIDIILLNSMLHFEKNDKKKEIGFLNRIANEIKANGIICICIWKSETIEKIIKDLFTSQSSKWDVLNDSYLDYTFQNAKSGHKVDMKYNMFIVKKIK